MFHSSTRLHSSTGVGMQVQPWYQLLYPLLAATTVILVLCTYLCTCCFCLPFHPFHPTGHQHQRSHYSAWLPRH
jgi:hypothetical protein